VQVGNSLTSFDRSLCYAVGNYFTLFHNSPCKQVVIIEKNKNSKSDFKNNYSVGKNQYFDQAINKTNNIKGGKYVINC